MSFRHSEILSIFLERAEDMIKKREEQPSVHKPRTGLLKHMQGLEKKPSESIVESAYLLGSISPGSLSKAADRPSTRKHKLLGS
jgi:hypothetical protein